MTAYDAVLFDNDGVLVEPPGRETQAAATRAAFAAVGVPAPDPADVAAVCDGLTVDGLHALCERYGVDPEAFWAAREELDAASQRAAFRAGRRTTYDDVSALADLDVPCGVVSNNHRETVAFVLDTFGLADAVETWSGRPKTVQSLERKKPDPYYLERAAADLDARSSLYVGDSVTDVRGARAAGMDAVFVRREHCREVTCSPAPTHEVSSLHEIPSIVADAGGATD